MTNLDLSIQGMNCGHCVNAVQQALAPLAGISKAEVKVGSAALAFDESLVSKETIVNAIQEEGYQVTAP
jgi:copper chaperone